MPAVVASEQTLGQSTLPEPPEVADKQISSLTQCEETRPSSSKMLIEELHIPNFTNVKMVWPSLMHPSEIHDCFSFANDDAEVVAVALITSSLQTVSSLSVMRVRMVVLSASHQQTSNYYTGAVFGDTVVRKQEVQEEAKKASLQRSCV